MVMDETIINGVEFVDVVYHLAASIAHKFLDECVSAKGNTQANVALSSEGGLCDHVLQREEVCIIHKETFGSCLVVDRAVETPFARRDMPLNSIGVLKNPLNPLKPLL